MNLANMFMFTNVPPKTFYSKKGKPDRVFSFQKKPEKDTVRPPFAPSPRKVIWDLSFMAVPGPWETGKRGGWLG